MGRWTQILHVTLLVILIVFTHVTESLTFTLVTLGISVVLIWITNYQSHESAIIKRYLYTLELILLSVIIFGAIRHLVNFSSDMRVMGREYSYLLNSGIFAHDMLKEFGSLPLWNPLIANGEPLFESPFSFILNPLMSFPLFFAGEIQGLKIGIMLAAFVAGWGGWCIAYILNLGATSRLMLGVLLAGNGSLAGLFAGGFYQMGWQIALLSWVLVGVLGIIYQDNQRRYALILIVSATLMIFAGTYWYVLPAGLIALALFIGAIQKPQVSQRKLIIVFAWTAFLTAGLCAIRLLPQAIHSDLFIHPIQPVDPLFPVETNIVKHLAHLFFPRVETTELTYRPEISQHFIFPTSFLLYLGIVRLFIMRHYKEVSWRSHIILPLIGISIFLILWAMESGDFQKWLYRYAELFVQWRWPLRVLGAVTPLVAIIAVIWVDDILMLLKSIQPDKKWVQRLVIIWSMTVALITIQNWSTWVNLRYYTHTYQDTLTALRTANPDGILMVITSIFDDYYDFYDLRIRPSFGNPDGIFNSALPEITDNYPTLPINIQLMRTAHFNRNAPGLAPRYALGPVDYFVKRGYTPLEINQHYFNNLLHNPLASPYAQTIDKESLTHDLMRSEPLDYVHSGDQIDVFVPPRTVEQIISIHETAYPGWKVIINEEYQSGQAFMGNIAVVIPANNDELTITFIYQPDIFYIGAVISGLFFLLTVGFVSGMDRKIRIIAVD